MVTVEAFFGSSRAFAKLLLSARFVTSGALSKSQIHPYKTHTNNNRTQCGEEFALLRSGLP